jgi:solute carrier family 10 (sodium/bile acid cotransporter), member 7
VVSISIARFESSSHPPWLYALIKCKTVLAGLGLKTEEFAKALLRLKYNAFVQLFNFGVVSGCTYAVCRFLVAVGGLDKNLADGLVMCSCLPMTISSVAVLTKASGGDEAAAIFNSTFSNMGGFFVSPLLMIAYVGVSGDTDLVDVFYKTAVRVVSPVLVGQICRNVSPKVVAFARKKKKQFQIAKEYSLVFLVYTVFCQTFAGDRASKLMDVLVMMGVTFGLFIGFTLVAWGALRLSFPNEPLICVAGLFACTQKTVSKIERNLQSTLQDIRLRSKFEKSCIFCNAAGCNGHSSHWRDL